MRKLPGVLSALAILFSATVYSQQNQHNPESELATQSVASVKRIALVIGNSAYSAVSPLKNAANDAKGIEKALKDLGFEVTLGINVRTRAEMLKLIAEWGAKITSDGVGLFYYAGHGAQVDGTNYLFPISTKMPNEGSVKQTLKQQAVDLDLVLRVMTTPDSHLNIVIIDACRNTLRVLRRLPPGLAAVIGSRGTYIAYATAPGSFASDGAGRNGLFTEHLLKHIRTPQLKIEDLFKLVRRDVTNDENNGMGQLPWDASSLLQDFYFNPGPIKPNVVIERAHPPVTQNGPTIRISTPPVYDPIGGETSSARIEGEVLGVDPKNLQVVLYSWTDKWYVQPTQANPFTAIAQDGRWETNIHTGTRYAALLVKRNVKPQNVTFKLPDVGGGVLAVTTVIGKKQ